MPRVPRAKNAEPIIVQRIDVQMVFMGGPFARKSCDRALFPIRLDLFKCLAPGFGQPIPNQRKTKSAYQSIDPDCRSRSKTVVEQREGIRQPGFPFCFSSGSSVYPQCRARSL